MIAIGLAGSIFLLTGTNAVASGSSRSDTEMVGLADSKGANSDITPITITSQPKSQTVIKENAVTVSVSAQGTGLQ